MRLVILGPQGSGKGTQAERLAKHLNVPHIDVGQMLRDEVSKKTPLGQKIEKSMTEGKFIPEKLSDAIVKKRLSESDASKGWVLDGFPRDLIQAEFLDQHETVDAVVLIDISDALSVKRLSARRICPKDHTVYGLGKKPKKAGMCDNDNTKLVQRNDDKPATIKKRLAFYHDETEPLMEYYKPRDLVYVIDGSKSPDKVFELILDALRTVGG